jgi:REP element-mobilizing transposase RayT
MILAHHLIITNYGFWLPNDPRGSWSDFVGSWELFRFGKSTKTETRLSVARKPHDRKLRLDAKKALKYESVHLTEKQIESVAAGFKKASEEGIYSIYACAILPEHSHLVIGRRNREIGQIAGHLKSRATQNMISNGLWRKGRPVWSKKYWNVFLDSSKKVEIAIEYVNNNPVREGKQPQEWPFIKVI